MSPSPAEFVKSLSRLDRRAVLALLVEDVYADRGRIKTLPLTSENGESLGYLIPPSDEAWNALAAHTINWDDVLTDEELEEITQRAIERGQESEPSDAVAAASQPARP